MVGGSDSHPFTQPIRTYILNKLATLLILSASNGGTYDASMTILQTEGDARNKLALDLVKAAGAESRDIICIELLKMDFVEKSLLRDLQVDNKILSLVGWIIDTCSIMGMRKVCLPKGMLEANETERLQLSDDTLEENEITSPEAFGKFYRIIQRRSRTPGKDWSVLADHKVEEAARELSSILVYKSLDDLVDIKEKLVKAYCHSRKIVTSQDQKLS